MIMKKLIFLSVLTFGFYIISFAQEYGWTDISANLPTEADLSDVFFVSDIEGWITSSSHAEIYHTTDGGETFKVQTTQLSCNAIHMLNENEGYAGGASGFIYKTTNGGENWDFYGTMVANLADISFPPTGNTGYCCGINGNIWSIDSTGVTKMISGVPDTQTGICFPANSSYGKVCGGSIILTYTNGIWGGEINSYPSGGYNAIYMMDTLYGWSVGDGGIIIYTEDGVNWFEQTNPSGNSLFDVYFLDINSGWAIGSGGSINHTNNGGESWNDVGVGLTSNSLTGVHFTSPTNGYVVGNNKTLLKYTEVSGIGDKTTPVEFEIFPNPVKDKIQIVCSGFKSESGKIEIFSLDGKEILEKEIAKGNENIEFDLNDLQSGMYLCKITINKRNSTKKIIKE